MPSHNTGFRTSVANILKFARDNKMLLRTHTLHENYYNSDIIQERN